MSNDDQIPNQGGNFGQATWSVEEKNALLESNASIQRLIEQLLQDRINQNPGAPAPPVIPPKTLQQKAAEMNFTKVSCLEFLIDKYDCISVSEVFNKENGKTTKKYIINFEYDVTGEWLDEPKISPVAKSVNGQPESVGTWPPTMVRPIADRYLKPSVQGDNSDEIAVATEKINALASKCVTDDKLNEFFNSKPLVRSAQGSVIKSLEVPFEPLNITKVDIKGPHPLFSNAEYHARKALQGTAVVTELLNAMKQRCVDFMSYWSLPYLLHEGAIVPDEAVQEFGPQINLGQRLTPDDMFSEFWTFRATLQLVMFELERTKDLNTATIVACKHQGRQLVLSNSSKSRGDPAYDQLLGSSYAMPSLFGHITDKLNEKIVNDGSGSVHTIPMKRTIIDVSDFSPRGKRGRGSYQGSRPNKRRRPNSNPYFLGNPGSGDSATPRANPVAESSKNIQRGAKNAYRGRGRGRQKRGSNYKK